MPIGERQEARIGAVRETVLKLGELHVISLILPEDGPLIESPDDSSIFSVSLRSCTPQWIPR